MQAVIQRTKRKITRILHYLVQDYLFLIHFSRAWALAVTKADDVAEMRACAATVNALVNDEISLHIRICAAAGIDEATLFSATEETANLAYTRYVLDAGHSGDFLDLMAALAPCLAVLGRPAAKGRIQGISISMAIHDRSACLDSH